MIEIDLGIPTELAIAMAKVLEDADDVLDEHPALAPRRTSPDEEDEDLSQTWHESLRGEIGTDRASMVRLRENLKAGQTRWQVDEEDAEPLIRALTEQRLHLRGEWLSNLSDSSLEGGEIRLENLPADERIPYLAYILLAGLQEHLIASINPDASV